ncbi:Protein SQS1 [Penicillium rolfsii]|nr:Protein SQS1 [Penicillium rolfsii]
MARHGKAKARAKRPPAMFISPSPHRFTMQQEARNTETHARDWQGTALHKKPVKFVRAGELQRSEFETVDKADQESEGQAEDGANEPSPAVVSPLEPTQEITEFGFFFDATPQIVTDTGLPDPTIRTQLSDFDDSSEDEVVFTGRKTGTRPIVIETSKEELQDLLHAPPTEPLTIEHEPLMADVSTRRNPRSEPSQNCEQPHTQDTRKWTREDEDNMLSDYIANMDTDYLENNFSHQQVELEGGIDVAEATIPSKSSAHGQDEVGELPTQSDYTRLESVSKEAQVESSIDVLSRMRLDTETDQVPDSSDNDDDDDDDDDDVDLDSLEEFFIESDDEDLDTELLEDLAINYLADRKKGGRSGKVSFASATAFADALEADPYYGLDMMDFNRPSLQKKGKGKKPPALDMMFSDSDLEAHLHDVWQNDRKKKKARKQEREELRAQGLLGRSTGEAADLKVKYSKGMNLEELITEVRSFLLSSNTSLALPAMTKHRRKTIHELANAMHLKSQSRGNGPSRFPMLIKTSRTPAYNRKTISKVDDLLSGKKLNRRLFQSWGSDASKYTKSVKARRGAVGGAVSYMDGDVVGGTAPEIGAENRGRAMLEKMGWSSGTALGAVNNKGILLPVAHVVKNSRTGLG